MERDTIEAEATLSPQEITKVKNDTQWPETSRFAFRPDNAPDRQPGHFVIGKANRGRTDQVLNRQLCSGQCECNNDSLEAFLRIL
jgi:hypothetical protein